jgi:metal-sulfur cluster biosynthetic enzyme
MTSETTVLNKDTVMEALRDVYDPEIPINVVDLGLIYDCAVDEGNVDIKMTLTFAGCGMGPYIAQQAEWRIAEIDGFYIIDSSQPLVINRIKDKGQQ